MDLQVGDIVLHKVSSEAMVVLSINEEEGVTYAECQFKRKGEDYKKETGPSKYGKTGKSK